MSDHVHDFSTMKDVPAWIGVAFRKGYRSSYYDIAVMMGTFGPYVHCELLIGNGSKARAYTSYNHTEEGSGFLRAAQPYTPDHWSIITYPMQDTKTALGIAVKLIGEKIPYNFNDLWQCCCKLILPLERELDADLTTTWKRGVFCSQMVLLFLRHMARIGDMQVNEVLKYHLENVHSRGCSPNALYCILCNHFKAYTLNEKII